MNEFKDSGIHLLIWRRSSSIHLLICGRRRTRPQQQSSSRAAAEQQPHLIPSYTLGKENRQQEYTKRKTAYTRHTAYTQHTSAHSTPWR
jgi:hypothetical protein